MIGVLVVVVVAVVVVAAVVVVTIGQVKVVHHGTVSASART